MEADDARAYASTMSRTLSGRAALLIAIAAIATFGACRGGNEPAPTAPPHAYTLEEAAAPGPYAVGVTTMELVDASRPTAANGSFPGSSERRITVEVWYPTADGPPPGDHRDAALLRAAAPYPLIIFVHGLSSFRLQSQSYTRHLASHGYVVAAPDFPLTNLGSPGGASIADLANQPEDVSFVIDRMLAFSGQPGHLMEGAVRPDAIGMTGHSFGAFTTLLTVYGPHRDERIAAALPIAGSGCVLSEAMTAGVSVPIMVMIGSDDLLIPRAGNRHAYELAHAPRYWVELLGGNHVRFADADVDDAQVLAGVQRVIARASSRSAPTSDPLVACGERPQAGGEPAISLARQQELLRTFATPFFDAYLKDDKAAKRFLDNDLPSLVAGAAKYEFEAK